MVNVDKRPLFLFIVLMIFFNTANAIELKKHDSSGGLLTTEGGSLEESKAMVEEYCKNSSPLVKSIVLLKDQFNIWGSIRVYQCSFKPTTAEEKRPTSIEQKTLQIRKVKKSIQETQAGINEWIKSSGYKGVVGSVLLNKAQGWTSINAGGGSLAINIELSSLPGGFTQIRLRTYSDKLDALSLPKDEFFDSFTYQFLFNQIAQELFVQTIELNPAELN
jgi:hypothetical protein